MSDIAYELMEDGNQLSRAGFNHLPHEITLTLISCPTHYMLMGSAKTKEESHLLTHPALSAQPWFSLTPVSQCIERETSWKISSQLLKIWHVSKQLKSVFFCFVCCCCFSHWGGMAFFFSSAC